MQPWKAATHHAAVFGPQQNPVAWPNAPLSQQGGKTPRPPRNPSVAGRPPPVSLEADHRNLAVVAAKVVKQCSQMVSHGSPGKDHGKPCRFGAVIRARRSGARELPLTIPRPGP